MGSSNRFGTLASDLTAYAMNNEEVPLVSSDGEEFKICKFILKARSPVFRAMFSNDTKETIENKATLEDVPASLMSKLISYLKKDEVDIEDSMALDLAYIADKYELSGLFLQLESNLISILNIENYEMIGPMACKFSSAPVLRAIADLIEGKPKERENGLVIKWHMKNYSELTELTSLVSPVSYILDIPWKIQADLTDDHLFLALIFCGTSLSPTCTFSLGVQCSDEEEAYLVESKEDVQFGKSRKSYAIKCGSWSEITYPTNGCIKDNYIEIEARFHNIKISD